MENALIVLAALVVFAVVFERLRLGAFLGYLGGGMVIGPAGFGLVENLEAIRHLAELGVVFLLFNLGLDLKFERLRLLGVKVYALGFGQLALTTAAIAGIAMQFDVAWREAIIIGGGLALSSTAVVLRVLNDLGRTLAQLGRASIAILLVQDLAVGPLLVIAEVFAYEDKPLGLALGETAIEAVVVLAVVVLVTRIVFQPAFKLAAKAGAPEIFVGTVLLLVLGASWLTNEAGLSMALGAFVAGLMVADSEYRHQVAADISPFRGLLLGLFFMTIGMGIDVTLLMAEPLKVALVVVGLMVVKVVVLGSLAMLLRFRRGLSVQLGFMLSQGSEFGFVLFAFAASVGVLGEENARLLILAIALTMIVAPVGALLVRTRLDEREGQTLSRLDQLDKETSATRGHVLVLGFGQVGMALTRHLYGLHVPVVVLDISSKRVNSSRAHGLPVFYGNAARADVLRAVHADQASVIVVTIPDAHVAETVVTLLKKQFPQARVLARASTAEAVEGLRKAGAAAIVVDGLATAMELAERVLLYHEPINDAASDKQAKHVAAENAQMLEQTIQNRPEPELPKP